MHSVGMQNNVGICYMEFSIVFPWPWSNLDEVITLYHIHTPVKLHALKHFYLNLHRTY